MEALPLLTAPEGAAWMLLSGECSVILPTVVFALFLLPLLLGVVLIKCSWEIPLFSMAADPMLEQLWKLSINILPISNIFAL